MIIIIYLIFDSKVLWVEQQHEKVRQKRGHHHQKVVARGITPRFADPLWDEQWYLVRKQHLNKFSFYRQDRLEGGAEGAVSPDSLASSASITDTRGLSYQFCPRASKTSRWPCL